MVKLAAHITLLLAMVSGLTVGLTASTAHTTQAASVVSLPSTGCTTQATGPDVVRQCGACTILGFHSNSDRDNLIHQIAQTSSDAVWLDVGNEWIGGDDATDLAGAVDCADRFGRIVERFTY